MLSEENYNILKEKYGHVSSWCVWSPAGNTPKSNTSDMSWMNDPNLLNMINTGYVFVGLNCSSTHGDQTDGGKRNLWINFHSSYCRQNDYKLRFALMGTKYWGSYITDLIKLYEEVDSSKVISYLNKHPEIVKKNITDFETEISYLGGKPILVALGGTTYKLLKENLKNKYQMALVKHYSYTIGKENYRSEVLDELSKY